MADYSYDVEVKCQGDCGKTRTQDYAARARFMCDDCRKFRVYREFDRMMGVYNESGVDAQFNAVTAIIERLMVLEGKLPPR